jgi:hypothetical protein
MERMEGWNGGIMEEWKDGKMEEWNNGRMASSKHYQNLYRNL